MHLTVFVYVLITFLFIFTPITLAQSPSVEGQVQPFARFNHQHIPVDNSLIDFWSSCDLVDLHTQDTQATVALLHQKNPNIIILPYRQLVGSPNVSGGKLLPWGKNSQFDEEKEWMAANYHENAFSHTADPASLLVYQTDNSHYLTWTTDKRKILSKFDLQDYVIYASNSRAGPYEEIDRVSKDTLSYQTTNTYNYYRIYSLLTDNLELKYSDIQEPTESSIIFSHDFTVSCAGIKPWDNYDCFHLDPEASVNISIKASISQVPDKLAVYFNTVRDKNFGYPDFLIGSKVIMTKNNQIYEANLANHTPTSGDYGGLGYYFVATYPDGTTSRFPIENVYTTNINNRIRRIKWGSYLIDIRKPIWTTFSKKWISYSFDTFGYDGIYFDLAATEGVFGHKTVDTIPLAQYGLSESELDVYKADYYQKKIQFFDAIRNNYPENLIIFNGAHKQWSILDYADGSQLEGFVVHKRFDENEERDWHQDMKDYLRLQDGNKIPVLTSKLPTQVYNQFFKISDETYLRYENYRWFSLTSYLLGKGSDKSYYKLGVTYAIPEYSIDLGSPIDSYVNVRDTILNYPLQDIYIRKYDLGTVIINQSKEKSYSLNQIPNWSQLGQYEVGLKRDIVNKIESLNFLETSGSTIIPMRSGRVLVHNLPTPTLIITPSSTPTPTPEPQFKQRLTSWGSDDASYDANGDGVVNSLDFASVITSQ